MPGPRCYIAVTGALFALMFVAHIARAFAEGSGLLREPFFIFTTVASVGLATWAAILFFRRPRA